MIADMIAGALLLAAFGCIIALVLRHRFGTHLGALEAELRKPCPAQSPRSDLPAEVVALAARLSACADGASSFIAFEQSGQMWRTPGGKPTDFTARQTIRVDAPGFLWRAAMGPSSPRIISWLGPAAWK